MKKFLATLLALVMALSLVACGSSKDGAKGSVYYLNFKPEAEEAWQALAKTYTEKTGVEVKVADLAVNDRSAIMTDVAKAGAVAFGAPTMNNQMFPAMADVLTYVKGLRPQNKIGLAFGSFGWSGEGAKQIAAELTAMGIEQPVEPFFQVKYMPTEADLQKAFDCGVKLGQELLARIGK